MVKLKFPQVWSWASPTMNITLAFILSLYFLGLYTNKAILRIPSLLLLLAYVCIIYMESAARYHRRCLRYHEEE